MATWDTTRCGLRASPRSKSWTAAGTYRRLSTPSNFIASGVDLVVFCGGDVTARDICSITGQATPILGIPAGVKMYSGVFGVTPHRTAEILARYLAQQIGLARVEIVDLDEDKYRKDESAVRLYMSARCPFDPKINEQIARLACFAETHPLQDEETVPGNLALMLELQQWLAEIGGFASVSLQPSAGAHGEFTGLLMMRAYHRERGDLKRTRILIPDSAHGTNPASTTMAGFTAVELPSDARGNIDLEAVRAACDDTLAGIMITNPNTLGLFEEHITEVVRLVHARGGLVHGDGANMNALVGIARPGDLGLDVMHYNLHKTFSTPHGGGGPGSGPVGVSARLKEFLPGRVIVAEQDAAGVRYALAMPAKSIGRVSTFFGNFGMFVRAHAYIRQHGAAGLRANSEHAVLNARRYVRGPPRRGGPPRRAIESTRVARAGRAEPQRTRGGPWEGIAKFSSGLIRQRRSTPLPLPMPVVMGRHGILARSIAHRRRSSG
jgi:hypothetical protein